MANSRLFCLQFNYKTKCYICQDNILFCLYFSLEGFREKRRANKMYKRIRDMREDRDLLQKDIAAYLNCTQVC